MEKLKILIITQGEWSPLFGAMKVHIDIKEEYERQGHTVDKLSFDDLYPRGQDAFSKIFGKFYTEYIYDFLKENAYKYDVIDANFSCVIYPKQLFGFKGLLLFRSHGIGPVYRWAEQNIKPYKQALEDDAKKITFKTHLGNLYRKLQKNAGTKEFDLSVKYADLVHCLNQAEYEYFIKKGVPKSKLLLLPNGIPDSFINDMNLSVVPNKEASLCFVGAWNVRKGIKDLDAIISFIEKSISLKEVLLIGGQHPKRTVETFFSPANRMKLNIIPEFDKSELKGLIESCKVGLFPSYVEGHPLAILEQLSLGIPVVAYRVPGSTDIVEKVDEQLLIAPGDIGGFANKVAELLKLDAEAYARLAEKCKMVSRRFSLSIIAGQFLSKYYECLGRNPKVYDYNTLQD